jgi:hypothetical protein
MPSLYRVGPPYGPHTYTARKRDAVKAGRELSREVPAEIHVCEIEAARLPLLDLLAAALNGSGWAAGRPVPVAAFLGGIEQATPPAPTPPPVRERVRQPVQAAPRVRERVRA